MKSYNLKFSLGLILSLFLSVFLVFNCSSPEEGTRTSGDRSERNQQDDDKKTTRRLECALPKCSGSKCCDEDDEQCKDWCGDNDYLDLSGDGYDKCLSLEKEFVQEQLIVLFGDSRLSEPDEEELSKIKTEGIEIICSAVRDLDEELLEDRIKDYSSYEAELIGQWIATQEEFVEVFKSTRDKKDGIEMLRDLLQKAGESTNSNESDDQEIVEGLKIETEFEDESKHLLERALDSNNKSLVEFIHKNIITDKDDGLCEKDKAENYIRPNESIPTVSYTYSSSNTRSTPTPGYARQCGAVERDGCFPGAIEQATEKAKYACILAVYCYIDNTSGGNRFRKDLARLVNNSHIKSFIRDPYIKGGLNLTSKKAQNEWHHSVCYELNLRWKSGPIDLGLDEVPNPNP